MAPEPTPGVGVKPPPRPAPAGSAGVLQQLKALRGIVQGRADNSVNSIGPDGFPLSADSPLRREHEHLSALYVELAGMRACYVTELSSLDAGQAFLGIDPAAVGRAVLAAAERHIHTMVGPPADADIADIWRMPDVARGITAGVVAALARSRFELDRAGRFDLLLYLSARPAHGRRRMQATIDDLIAQADRDAATSPLSEGERYVLSLLRTSLIPGAALGTPSEEVRRLDHLIGDGGVAYLAPGDVWSDAVNVELPHIEAVRRRQWATLLGHALKATAPRPSGRWNVTARSLADAIGADQVREALLRWLPLVAQGRTKAKPDFVIFDLRVANRVMDEENATCLRGLLWLTRVLPPSGALARAVGSVALWAYKKVPGVGPRLVKVGNAAVYALSQMGTADAVGQLATIKVRVRSGTAQKEIEKAFTAAAGALGLPPEQIEEMVVPSYGLEDVGRRRESFGGYRAELIVNGSAAELNWFDADGKPLRSVPARVKSDHKDDLKDLQQSLADIRTILPAQRDRIDAMFLLRKTWPMPVWRERYLDHPLIGTVAHRLIWCLDGIPALLLDGRATDVRGRPVAPGETAEVTLWHPVGRALDDVLSWRRRLEELGITQPFKQAHREVYVLTDAERNTRTYSNRFAAHVIRQHQFHALCAARGWRNKLRLMVGDSYPPATKDLPLWGLRAEFWIEGVGDAYGTDTNESGVYLRLATDQVRFYRREAAENSAYAGGGYRSSATGPGAGRINEPVPLEEVPPLVFSEVMRDVDLFVGVGSVGNDPSWQDGGPGGRYRQYWRDYAFGDLSGTAATRKQVLERLVPRLSIADRCSFTDRFLVVRGRKRTYKIHLGSGNILMEPNDEYLCIVPDSRSRAKQDDLFLPFEGDGTLSIIISKALLLADDTTIKDRTIMRQIERG
jgi:hypothetical protein